MCGGDAVCPCGAKALQSGAPSFGLSRERAESHGALPIRNGWQARRGGRGISDAGMRATPLQPFCADKIPISVPSARPVSHAVPQGERRALPAPAQGINPLRIPFWGTGLHFPVAPFPNAAGGRLLLLSLPPSTSTTAPTEPKRSNPAPFVTGRGCVAFGPTALAVDTVD